MIRSNTAVSPARDGGQLVHPLGSTIIGLDDHTPENIDDVIDYGVGHETDFHQFASHLAVAGTPLDAELEARGVLKDESEYDLADIHGQFIFKHHHGLGAEGETAPPAPRGVGLWCPVSGAPGRRLPLVSGRENRRP